MMIPGKIKREKVTGAQKTAISILSVSIINFFYFAITILMSKLKYEPILLGVIREMFTIPGLIILGITFIIALLNFIKNKWKINTISFYSLIIQLATMGLIFYIA